MQLSAALTTQNETFFSFMNCTKRPEYAAVIEDRSKGDGFLVTYLVIILLRNDLSLRIFLEE